LHGLLADRVEARPEADAARLFQRLAGEDRQVAVGVATVAEPGPETLAEAIRILEHAFGRCRKWFRGKHRGWPNMACGGYP